MVRKLGFEPSFLNPKAVFFLSHCLPKGVNAISGQAPFIARWSDMWDTVTPEEVEAI